MSMKINTRNIQNEKNIINLNLEIHARKKLFILKKELEI
jgi:hypothetical protein